MIRVCCSDHHVGDRTFGEKEPFEDKSETHGYCDECFKLERVEIQRAHKKLREAGFSTDRIGHSVENLTNLEAIILRFLEAHQGKDFAISRERLVEKINGDAPLIFRVSERAIRETIKHLITQHGECIGSCHRGYFMVETSEELETVCKYYHSYGLSSLYVEAKLRKMNLAELLGQLSLELQHRTCEQAAALQHSEGL